MRSCFRQMASSRALAKHRADTSPDRLAERQARRLDRDLQAILLAAAGALIDQFHSVGIGDAADIARRLNRRGFPCFGRGRWTAGAVRNVLRRRARDDGAEALPASAVAPRPLPPEPMRAP
jgi:hypothetical protein